MIYLWLALNALDALLTILIVRAGGFEANPIMAWALSLGYFWFITVKAAGSLIVLCLFSRSKNIMAGVNVAFSLVVLTGVLSLAYLIV